MVLIRSGEHTTTVLSFRSQLALNFGFSQLVFTEVQGKVTLLP